MAGHETIAVALSWCLYLLDAHRDVQDRVRAECRDALGASAPPAAGFRELPLTQAVIEEAMRLYPPVWSVGREAIGEDMLGDARVPVGATVMISPYALHRRPDFWDAPEAFRPERFLGSTDRHPFVYVPFGAGARSCIGNHVSMLEMRVALSMIVRRYAIERTSREPVATEALVSLRPKPDFDVRLTRID
jgi:cytochrome P450